MTSVAEIGPNLDPKSTADSYSPHLEEVPLHGRLAQPGRPDIIVERNSQTQHLFAKKPISEDESEYFVMERSPIQMRMELHSLLESRRKPDDSANLPIGHMVNLVRKDGIIYQDVRLLDVPDIDDTRAPLSELTAHVGIESDDGQMEIDTLSLDSLYSFSLSRVMSDAEVEASFQQEEASLQQPA